MDRIAKRIRIKEETSFGPKEKQVFGILMELAGM